MIRRNLMKGALALPAISVVPAGRAAAAASEFPDPVFGHPVELLVTDKRSYARSGVHWRRAEARAVARRVREAERRYREVHATGA